MFRVKANILPRRLAHIPQKMVQKQNTNGHFLSFELSDICLENDAENDVTVTWLCCTETCIFSRQIYVHNF
jgi:hypothetical protein